MRPCIEKAFFNGLCRRQKDLSARSRCFAGFAFKIHAIKKSACMEALFFPPICSRSPKEASCRRHARCRSRMRRLPCPVLTARDVSLMS